MGIHSAKSIDPAKFAIDVATPALSTDVTQAVGTASTPEAPARRKSGVERYFRKSRDRALREATGRGPLPGIVPADAQGDGGCASASVGKADATTLALQVAENEGWKYRDCADRPNGSI